MKILKQWNKRIESALAEYINQCSTPSKQLLQAMQYAVFNGGKRLRPKLVFATGSCFTSSLDLCIPAACAVEFMHCYSLVHDDLPAMDNDALRRGKPSTHVAFGEDKGILVGDALQSLAFFCLTDIPYHLKEALLLLSKESGAEGMVGGQALDLEAENQEITLDELERIHTCKTGALIRASILMGALSVNCRDHDILDSLSNFAHHLGLAFQIQDDILDMTGDSKVIGKSSGKDADNNKATYVTLLDLETAEHLRQKHAEQATSILNNLPINTEALASLLAFTTKRAH